MFPGFLVLFILDLKVMLMQASFLEALLTQGYHFAPKDWSNIVVVKRLGQPPAEV